MTPLIVGAMALLIVAFFLFQKKSVKSPGRSERSGSSASRRSAGTAQVAVDVGGHVKRINERRDRGPDRRLGVGLASELWANSGQPDRRVRNRGRRSFDLGGLT